MPEPWHAQIYGFRVGCIVDGGIRASLCTTHSVLYIVYIVYIVYMAYTVYVIDRYLYYIYYNNNHVSNNLMLVLQAGG